MVAAVPLPATPSVPVVPKPSINLMPLDLLLSIVRDEGEEMLLRIECSKIAAPYCHAKPVVVVGKKDTQAEAAGRAARGKYGSAPAPLRLASANGK